MPRLGESFDAGDLARYGGLAIVWGAGLLMGLVEVRHISEMSSTVGVAAFALLPFVVDLGLIGAGVVLLRSRLEGPEVLRVAGWVVVGVTTVGLLATWTITHQNVRGRAFAHAPFVVVNNMSVGGLIGFVVGWYDVRSRRRQRAIDDERDKLRFLNRLLRHNVFNGMQVVRGQVDLLEEHVAEAGRRHLDPIRDRTEAIVRIVEGVRTLTRESLEGDTDGKLRPVDLSEVLVDEIERVRRDFSHGQFETDLPAEATVMADDFVAELFGNLLTNAVRHDDGEAPTVAVSARTTDGMVVVEIADENPAVPADGNGNVVGWSTTETDATDVDVGLAIADTLAERYDGELRIETDGSMAGSVTVELPRTVPRAE